METNTRKFGTWLLLNYIQTKPEAENASLGLFVWWWNQESKSLTLNRTIVLLPMIPFPLLPTPTNYKACTIPYRFPSDDPGKATPTEISWINVFANSIPSFKFRPFGFSLLSPDSRSLVARVMLMEAVHVNGSNKALILLPRIDSHMSKILRKLSLVVVALTYLGFHEF